jgi:hypothetical protein
LSNFINDNFAYFFVVCTGRLKFPNFSRIFPTPKITNLPYNFLPQTSILFPHNLSSFQKPKRDLPTYEEIRDAIPKQCFEKSLPTSLAYLVWDFAVLTGLYLILPYVEGWGGWFGLLGW